MAKDASFDIVSQADLQMVDDAVNTAMREIDNRFDLKGLGISITLERTAKTITLFAPSDFQIDMIKQILVQKMTKRGLSAKVMKVKTTEAATGGAVREVNDIITGVDKEVAKTIIKDIKDMKYKVQTSIQDEQIRVVSPSKDELQKVIALIRGKDYPIALQFTNFR
ncbi:MAG: YajQ family cyclic di-GMP-binding protein [Spirochaetes bacterium]|nr:YajQ family cyclic di-GMP-binding protein [Spirochaetota bacterium]